MARGVRKLFAVAVKLALAPHYRELKAVVLRFFLSRELSAALLLAFKLLKSLLIHVKLLLCFLNRLVEGIHLKLKKISVAWVEFQLSVHVPKVALGVARLFLNGFQRILKTRRVAAELDNKTLVGNSHVITPLRLSKSHECLKQRALAGALPSRTHFMSRHDQNAASALRAFSSSS